MINFLSGNESVYARALRNEPDVCCDHDVKEPKPLEAFAALFQNVFFDFFNIDRFVYKIACVTALFHDIRRYRIHGR